MTRRAFIAGLGGATAYVVARGPRWRALLLPASAQPSNGTAVRTVTMLRREDMFKATFRFYDVSFSGAGASMTFAPNGANPTVVVELPPQAIGEQAFFSEPAKDTLARATLSGPTRIAFEVDGTEPFTAAALMSWTDRVLRLTPATQPSIIETAIEAPWGIQMAPPQGLLAGPRVFPAPQLTYGGITGLWTAELGTHIASFDLLRSPPPLRVTGVRTASGGDPFVLPIDGDRRIKIRNATQNSDPVDLNLLVLSPLGAWVDLEGNWSGNVAGAAALTHWRQRSTMGRDQYVRIIEKGFLFPFGHRAVEITITERKISPVDNRAYLYKRSFIAVKQPVIDYDASPAVERDGGRRWPFRTVRLTTLVTPDLQPNTGGRESVAYGPGYVKKPTEDPFWVKNNSGAEIRFGVVATDWDGRDVEFSLPMLFAKISSQGITVPNVSATYMPAALKAIVDYYNGLPSNSKLSSAQRQRSTIQLGGQKVALAPSDSGGVVVAPSPAVGKASYQASRMVLLATNAFDAGTGLDVAVNKLLPNDIGAFRPEIGEVDLRIDQIDTMLGGSAKPAKVTLNAHYIANGNDDNPSGVFANLVTPVGVTFPSDRSGGLVTPNMSIEGLARDLGPVGDVASLVGSGAGFDPDAFFPSTPTPDVVLPMLLGGLPLPSILATTGNVTDAPQITTSTLYPGGDATLVPDGFETRLDWVPTLQNFGPFVKRSGAALEVHGLFVTKLSANTAQTSEITGELRNFAIELGPIAIDFDQLRFSSRNGSKPEVDVEIADVGFIGDLAFLNELAAVLQDAGLGGLAIDADAHHVEASYTLGVPDMGVGVFALKNLTMTAGLSIPFKGDDPSTLAFDLGSQADPFLLSVSLFAGSGYFGIELTPAGVKSMRVSLGFGAAVAFNIPPVLYGSITIQAGVLIALETTDEEDALGQPVQIARVGGFLSIKGEAEVGGVVTVSISLYLSFEYVGGGGRNKIHAEGVLTIEVDVVLFSKTITKTVTYDIGDGADPTVAQALTNNDWYAYTEAFNPAPT